MVINKMDMHKKRQRALAHVEKIAWIRPIEDADNIELVGVLGWVCIAKIGEFQVGDWCVYIEIDSKVPEKEWSEFLRPKHFKIKTMKLGKFKVISQGIALPLSTFDVDIPQEEGKDVTKLLGVKYSVAEDNFRKSEIDKYKAMAQRRPDVFKKPWARRMMKNPIGKRIMFLLYGKKRDDQKKFPKKFQFVHPTDESRIENMPWILEDRDARYIKTTKIDGTSTTFILEKKLFGYEFYVLSRNVRQFTPEQGNYHSQDENVYWEVAEKYNVKDFLMNFMKGGNYRYVALQGETYGCTENGVKIQGDPHHIGELRFAAFNLIDSKIGRWDSVEGRKWCSSFGIPWVPIVDTNCQVESDMEAFKLTADGPCEIPGSTGLREGYVYRKVGDPNFSFKNVSRKYLLKHGE